MPKLATWVRPCSVLAVITALPFAFGAEPARAEDIFGGFFKALSSALAPAPAPAYQMPDYRLDPGIERPRPKAHPRPKPASADESAIRKPVEPKPPGEVPNPVPALLADGTLQPGDLVMFPDGLRVFTGRVGDQHRLDDFKPLAKAGKSLPREMRKLVAHLLPSENPAWSTDGLKAGHRLAANTKDVETTGSVKRPRR